MQDVQFAIASALDTASWSRAPLTQPSHMESPRCMPKPAMRLVKTHCWQWIQGRSRGALSQRLLATDTWSLLQMLHAVLVRAQEPRRTSRKLSEIQDCKPNLSRAAQTHLAEAVRDPCHQQIAWSRARTSRKLSGIQSSRRSGTPSMSVIQSADVTEPRMATTTLLLSWSSTTM